jgi:GTPase
MSRHRSGFVTIIGRPNAGKSTLLNALVGGKLAIVSEKPQTTRTSVQGVLTIPGAQIVFVDTPGIHESKTLLNRRMMDVVRAALEQRDLILYLADCTLAFGSQEEEALALLSKVSTPALLLLTKVDLLRDKRGLLPRIEQFKAAREFQDYLPISAVTGEGVESVRDAIVERLPAGPLLFPSDYLTDQPERFLAAELIREKILSETRQEVPHSVAVMVDKWEEKPRLTRIAATIFVERPGQKAILIGSKGALMKKIGSAARLEIEAMLRKKVFLEMFVKVRNEWRDNPEFLKAIDWRSPVGAELDSDLEK